MGPITGTFISRPVIMDSQIGYVLWCSSYIISGLCCDGDLWLGKVKFVPFAPVLENFEAENYCRWLLKLEPLEVWYHR